MCRMRITHQWLTHITINGKVRNTYDLGGRLLSFQYTSLPESWDNYTSAYLGSSGNKPTLTSHELIAILLEEDRRRKGQIGDSAGTTLHVTRHPKMGRQTKQEPGY